MRVRSDGSVQSAATPTYQNSGRTEDYAFYRCMVTKVVYADDPANISTNGQTPRVMYDVVVLGGFASGQIISNCRLASDLGGNDTYWERTLRASEKDVSKTKLSECDGDVVFVQFIQGHTGYPIITMMDQGINMTKTKTGILGAKLADGPRSIRLYNGVWEEIDKDGQLTQKIFGGKANADKGSFVPASEPLVTFKTDKTQKHSRIFKAGLSIVEDGVNDKVTITTKGGMVFTINGTGDKVELTTKGGAKLTVDGTADKIDMVSKGGAKFSVDGQSGSVTAQDNAGGKLKISSSKVGLGTASNELVDLVKQLADALAAATYPGFGAPASNVADYITIGGKLASIKGGV